MQCHGLASPTPRSHLCFLDQHFSNPFPTFLLSHCDICYISNTCSAQVGNNFAWLLRGKKYLFMHILKISSNAIIEHL
jgi:hypothetical protein